MKAPVPFGSRAVRSLQGSVYLALTILLCFVVSRPAIRNAANMEFLEGYLSQDHSAPWLRAESIQRSALNLQEKSIDESIRLARIVLALGRTEEAITIWKAAGQPFAPFLLLEFGNSLRQSGEQSRALTYWQLVPDLDMYFALRGLATEKAGDSEAALADYQISWEIDDHALPRKGDALQHFCELLRQRHQIAQAIMTCKRARESGNTFWADLTLGVLYSDLRDFLTAETYFRQALAERPDHARANLWVGLSLANQGKLSQAMQFYRRGLILAPNDGWLNYLMGKALWDSGLQNDAREYFELSVQFVPDSWEAVYLEDALRLLGQPRP